jgi:hypothetical protein
MIYEKLYKFSKKNITIEKDGVNPHFKNRYSTLTEVLSKVKPVLAEMGILILQQPEVEGLKTRLIDLEDNSEVSGTMPWEGVDNPQKVLACTTYYRRGSLISMLGLEDEDNDGEDTVARVQPKKGVIDQNDSPF